MVRRSWVLVVGCAAVLLGGAPASGAPGDAAHGGGHITIDGENRTFAFTAREGADGDKGQAQLQARQEDARLHIDIDCLRVVGNRAWAAGVVTHSTTPTVPPGTRSIFVVEDNGEGGKAPADRLSLVFSGTGGFFDCEVSVLAPSQDVERGNIQVRPAT